jgi:hypothetical protein
VQGHLSALETNLVKAARARFLALVAAASRLTEAATSAAANALHRVLCALGGLDRIESHKIP